MEIEAKRMANWLIMSSLIGGLLTGKAMAQSSSDTYPMADSVTVYQPPVAYPDERADGWRERIGSASLNEVAGLFTTLFWLSPELAQSIPCLPPLGDWSGNRISSGFGWRNHPTLRTIRHHDGIDIAGPHQYVRTAATGIVTAVGWSASLGKYVQVDHLNSYETLYGHLAMVLVRPGQPVRIGETLGITGRTGRATGVHLHYSVLKQGLPVNPTPYLTLAIEFVHTYQRQLNRTAHYQQPITASPTWQK